MSLMFSHGAISTRKNHISRSKHESSMSPVSLEALRSGQLREPPRRGTHLARAWEFLRSHPDQAWPASELAEELGVDQHTLGAALRRLHARGLVHKHGRYWYATSEREGAQLAGAIAVTRELNERHGREDPADWPDVEQE